VSISTGNTEDIIEILGNLQSFLRKPIIKNKLIDFFKKDSEFQLETINLILDSLENINIQKFRDLISSWLEVLVYFEPSQINQIIILYLNGLQKRRELINPLEPVLFNCINKMSKEEKEKLRDCFLETLFMIPNKNNILNSTLSEETLAFILRTNDLGQIYSKN
jgi:hypothetical protein